MNLFTLPEFFTVTKFIIIRYLVSSRPLTTEYFARVLSQIQIDKYDKGSRFDLNLNLNNLFKNKNKMKILFKS
jgi:hypothetical protein